MKFTFTVEIIGLPAGDPIPRMMARGAHDFLCGAGGRVVNMEAWNDVPSRGHFGKLQVEFDGASPSVPQGDTVTVSVLLTELMKENRDIARDIMEAVSREFTAPTILPTLDNGE